jgi:SSS family solute:Na+ symporter
MGWVFFFTTLLIIAVSLLDVKGRANVKALEVDKSMNKVSNTHLAMIIVILLLVAVIYARFW